MNIMKKHWVARGVLTMSIQWTDALKQKRLLRGAATKETLKLSAPVPKSIAVTAKPTPEPS